MATVTVSPQQLEEHLDNNGVEVYSFTWNRHSSEPEIEFSVISELNIDDEDLVEKDEYDELDASYKQVKLLLEESEEELQSVKERLKELQAEYDELDRVYNKLKNETSMWDILKFWK